MNKYHFFRSTSTGIVNKFNGPDANKLFGFAYFVTVSLSLPGTGSSFSKPFKTASSSL